MRGRLLDDVEIAPESRRSIVFRTMVLGLGSGLIVGLVEVVALSARTEWFLRGIYRKSPHFVWMIPASLGLVFAVVGALLGAFPSRHRVVEAASRTAILTLAILALLLTIPGLRASACLAMSLGLACWGTPRLRSLRIWNRATIGASAAVAVLAAAAFVAPIIREHRAVAGRSEARKGAPNVLLIVMDTVRADALSTYGYARETTPNLSRLAARGVRFDHAVASASWTLPSHASMFTGRWPDELSVGLNEPLDAADPTLAGVLADRGYATAGFAANTYFCNRWYGLARGFDHFEDYPLTPMDFFRSSALGFLACKKIGAACDSLSLATGRSFRHDFGGDTSRKDADRINRDALAWIDAPRARPFFAFLNYLDAHDPYESPDPHSPHFGLSPRGPAERMELRDWMTIDKAHLPPRARALARDNYDDCLAYLDDRIGRLVDHLERRGLMENTLVVITSDHGEHFGEHGLYGHRASVYGAVTHVPLLIFGAGASVPPGVSVRRAVSLRDLPATVADLVGLSDRSPFPGRSLASTWKAVGSSAQRDDPPLSIFDYRAGLPSCPHPSPEPARLTSIVREGMMLVVGEDGHEELYDIEADPDESRDEAGDEEFREVREQLRREVDDHFRHHHP